jgi:hypothetical protein
MTVTLELPPEKEAVLKAEVDARGVSVERLLLELCEQHVQPGSIAHLQKTNPKEWMRQFRAWAEGHSRTTPLLSDEAAIRENIYPDRI